MDPQLPIADDTRPSLAAAVVLWARQIVGGFDNMPRTAAEVLALTGAGHSQAYEMLDRLKQNLPNLLGHAGRPPATPSPSAVASVLRAVCDFIMANPGAVCGQGARRTYSDAFRRFVLGLAAPGQPGAELTVEALADAVGISLGTLKDWLRLPEEEVPPRPFRPSIPLAISIRIHPLPPSLKSARF